MHSEKRGIPAVRAIVREEGSSLLDHVTDAQIDAAIQRDINRPAVTATLLAGAAADWCEQQRPPEPKREKKLTQKEKEHAEFLALPREEQRRRWRDYLEGKREHWRDVAPPEGKRRRVKPK